MSTTTLHRLLDDALRLPPETRSLLTSHLPMALHALHELGAGDDRLVAFFGTYASRFEGQGAPAAAAPVADWRLLRGQPDSFAAPQATFSADLARDGEAAVLRRVLPDLLSGAAAAAFHGPIRTAHALQAGHRGELAAALAYWAWRWQAMAPPRLQDQALDFDDWTARLIDAALRWTPEGPLISIRMQIAETSEPYQALAGRLRPAPDTLQRLSRWAAERYATTRSFTVLHIVTGLRALKILLPWAGEATADAAAPGLVHAVTAAYLAARMSQWPVLPAAPGLAWHEAVAAAVRSDDDHVIKLVHACRDENARQAHPAWLNAATRAVT